MQAANARLVWLRSANMRAPHFHLPAGPKKSLLDRIASDTDIYTRSLNGIVAAAAASVGAGAGAHRWNVGVVPSGLPRMYELLKCWRSPRFLGHTASPGLGTARRGIRY